MLLIGVLTKRNYYFVDVLRYGHNVCALVAGKLYHVPHTWQSACAMYLNATGGVGKMYCQVMKATAKTKTAFKTAQIRTCFC